MKSTREKRILLTGSSGWFGRSFIAEYLKHYGIENLQNVIPVTSDGRQISHPMVSGAVQTISLSQALMLSEIDLIVQAGFPTRDKLGKLGRTTYEAGCLEVTSSFKRILEQNPLAKVVLISSGAVYNDSSLYGQYKRLEETVAIQSENSSVAVFRIFGATSRFMDYRDWSAVCSFLKSKINSQDILIESKSEIMRGLVCMEDLSHVILKMCGDNQARFKGRHFFDAVSDVSSIREIAEFFADCSIQVSTPIDFDLKNKDYSYTGNSHQFIKLSQLLEIELKSSREQVDNLQNNFYLNSYRD